MGMAATPGVNAGIHTQGDYFQQPPQAGANGQQQQQQQQQQERPLYLCQPFVKAALVKGSFKTIVAPPKYVDVNEWVAINSESGSFVEHVGAFVLMVGFSQSLTFTTTSTTFTEPSQSFVDRMNVILCRRRQGELYLASFKGLGRLRPFYSIAWTLRGPIRINAKYPFRRRRISTMSCPGFNDC